MPAITMQNVRDFLCLMHTATRNFSAAIASVNKNIAIPTAAMIQPTSAVGGPAVFSAMGECRDSATTIPTPKITYSPLKSENNAVVAAEIM